MDSLNGYPEFIEYFQLCLPNGNEVSLDTERDKCCLSLNYTCERDKPSVPWQKLKFRFVSGFFLNTYVFDWHDWVRTESDQ